MKALSSTTWIHGACAIFLVIIACAVGAQFLGSHFEGSGIGVARAQLLISNFLQPLLLFLATAIVCVRASVRAYVCAWVRASVCVCVFFACVCVCLCVCECV